VDNFIIVADSFVSTSYRVGIIQTVDRSISEDSKKILHVEGQEAKTILSYRYVDPGTSARYTASAVFESAVKALVNSQAGSTATDANRVFPGFSVAATQGRGSTYAFSERWSNLSEAVQKGCIATETGYTIYWSGAGMVFDTIYGYNRTLGNNINNPAIFSTDFDTVKESHFILSKSSYKNYAYTGGRGVGTGRVIQPVFVGGSAPTGYARREMFIDARDLSATADLTVRGTQELSANSYQKYTSAVINPYSSFAASSGVDLGDLCTIDAFGYQTSARITGVTEQWGGSAYDCSLAMDRSQATVESVVSNEKYSANRAGSYVEGYIVESIGDESNGYKKCSDGTLEQWGTLANSTTMTSASPDPGYFIRDIVINFTVAFSSTSYHGWGSSGSGICDAFSVTPNTVSSAYGNIWCAHSYGSRTIRWNVRGHGL